MTPRFSPGFPTFSALPALPTATDFFVHRAYVTPAPYHYATHLPSRCCPPGILLVCRPPCTPAAYCEAGSVVKLLDASACTTFTRVTPTTRRRGTLPPLDCHTLSAQTRAAYFAPPRVAPPRCHCQLPCCLPVHHTTHCLVLYPPTDICASNAAEQPLPATPTATCRFAALFGRTPPRVALTPLARRRCC